MVMLMAFATAAQTRMRSCSAGGSTHCAVHLVGMHEPVNAIDGLNQRFWHRRLTTQDEANTVQVCARLPFHTALTAT